jgi:DNA polymerase III subunit chi
VRIDFYHLSALPLEKVLPSICERLLSAGERLLIVTEQAEALDAQLWTYAPDSFLPHGLVDAPRAAEQPVLISRETEPVNEARNIALADGVWREAAFVFDRTFYFFDAASLDAARSAWRGLNNRPGLDRRYWKQVDGRWVQGP